MPQAEALSQEITSLRNRFGGKLIYLNPNQHSRLYWPRLLFGFQHLKKLRLKEAGLDLHHLYNPDPFPFPILRWLRRPVVYTITSGVGTKCPPTAFFSALAAISVADERSLKRLRAWGLHNSFLVRPGIDTSRFTFTPLPLQSEIRLMVGSAPWTKKQFRSKGVDGLLEAAQQMPNLHLIFLWRGVLTEAMRHRVRQMKLERQVTILDKLVDVNTILADVHASITLADAPGIVKSYPHSLLDSLAAGKPVLVSQAIPMADYVAETGCGKVIEQITPADILMTVEALAREYEALQQVARQVGQRDFSQRAMFDSYHRLYQQVLQAA
jgi:glycosyltransferase involved in cell wall biosynthesis